jgi:hypothetical protein
MGFMTKDIVQAKDNPKKDFWCWHCLKWIRWRPNSHQIQDMQELLQRPYRERHLIMPIYGMTPDEASMDPRINRKDLRESGVQQLNPYPQNLSLMNLLEEAILWKEEQGGSVPYCPYCERSLLNQNKWASIRGWVKYSLLTLALVVSLWLLIILLR